MERDTEPSLGSGPSVVVVSEQHYARQAQPRCVIEELRRHGTRVHAHSFAAGPVSAEVSGEFGWAEVVVARGRSEQLLAVLDLALQAALAGVDPPGAVRAVRDKARMGAAFGAAGMRVPAMFTGTYPVPAVGARVEAARP